MMTRRIPAPPCIALAAALAVFLTTGAAIGQTAPPPATPPDSSGPQTSVPTPRADGQADVPGGSSLNGVVRPPVNGGSMAIIPPPQQGKTPIIMPPGTNRAQPNLVPK